MSATRGVVAGVMGLSLLQLLVSKPSATANAGTLVTLATGTFRRLVDPTVPLIPNLAKNTTRVLAN